MPALKVRPVSKPPKTGDGLHSLTRLEDLTFPIKGSEEGIGFRIAVPSDMTLTRDLLASIP